eukprot:CAMPEP_0197544570 /NCGR_PEP_ID=MMETSP1318-20131121/68840_1 /TAXON_ID=552666 /ORGANISM="Partenskyella glossopodia, Strain RCC365" /LENGTH=75 /DNA_ID=CAMNT_0043103973 /DNA_START=685 /DNA_END=909 /DNA_ORIENTATION=+
MAVAVVAVAGSGRMFAAIGTGTAGKGSAGIGGIGTGIEVGGAAAACEGTGTKPAAVPELTVEPASPIAGKGAAGR